MSAAGAVTHLRAHPDTPRVHVWSIDVEAQFTGGTSLSCRYRLRGDTARLRLLPVAVGRRADGLWRHTCFEAFVAAAGTAGYYELNFSPARDWAAYRFAGYRTGMCAATLDQPPALEVRCSSDALELAATVHLAGLAPLRHAPALRLALAAVIEENDGRLGYWALWHPPGNPDFHHSEGFTLELPSA